LTRNLTVLQALARAGRFTEYADKTRIRLIRGSEVVTVNAVAITDGKQKDITIIPGDVIEVPRTWY
jgi:protein involved in polysaccharide export with SLBB domain